MAVGLFNIGTKDTQGSVTWKNLGLRGKQKVRDLWRQTDVAESEEGFTTQLAPHGTRLIKIYPGNSREQATSGR